MLFISDNCRLHVGQVVIRDKLIIRLITTSICKGSIGLPNFAFVAFPVPEILRGLFLHLIRDIDSRGPIEKKSSWILDSTLNSNVRSQCSCSKTMSCVSQSFQISDKLLLTERQLNEQIVRSLFTIAITIDFTRHKTYSITKCHSIHCYCP